MNTTEPKVEESNPVPQWQKEEVRIRTMEAKKDPSKLIDESFIFEMLNL